MIPELFCFSSSPTLVILDLEVEIKRNHQHSELRRQFYRSIPGSYLYSLAVRQLRHCRCFLSWFHTLKREVGRLPPKSQDLPFTLFDFISASHGLFMSFYTKNFHMQ